MSIIKRSSRRCITDRSARWLGERSTSHPFSPVFPFVKYLAASLAILMPAFIQPGCTDNPGSPRPTLSELVTTTPEEGGSLGIDPGGAIEPAATPQLSEEPLSFTASRAFCCNPLRIEFTANHSASTVLQNAEFEWDYGDGRQAFGPFTEHVYDFPGEYPVVLRVTLVDTTQRVARRLLTLGVGTDGVSEITLSPQPPFPGTDPADDSINPASLTVVADAGKDLVVPSGGTFVLDGRGSTGSGSAPLRYQWDQVFGSSVFLSTPTSSTVTLTAPAIQGNPKTLVFTLTVTQGESSASDMVAFTVIADSALSATGGLLPQDVDEDADGLADRWERRFFGGLTRYGSTDDPDGDALDNQAEFDAGTNPTRPDVDQFLLNKIDLAIQSFWESRDPFLHAVDGTLVGWPMVKTMDRNGPPFWMVDNKNTANEPVLSIMGPGVPDVGMTMLRAYQTTGNKRYLRHALEAARTLLSLQKELERNADGSVKPSLQRGGWINFAAIVADDATTRSEVPGEIGHWTTVRVSNTRGDLHFVSRDKSYMTFDDSISTDAAMFLLEVYDAIKEANFSGEEIDPLRGINRRGFLDAATKFFRLADAYRSDFVLRKSDFENIFINYQGSNRAKDGPHPFVAYLKNLSTHPLSQGRPFKPYANGGLPHGIEEIDRMIRFDGAKFGALAAGRVLHKYFNDHVMSKFVLFLLRYYEVTNDAAALNNLQLQLDWLGKVFQADGSRGWCQQYHVLDDTCAPARPWEPPAFAMNEGIAQIRRLGFLEKRWEETHGLTNVAVRTMLEDAIYYVSRVVQRDEPGLLFQYYALRSYNVASRPNSFPDVLADDPVFSCDFYYPDDPFKLCVAPFDQLAFHYYLIDESRGVEFVAPNGDTFLSDIGDGQVDQFMIEDACLTDPRTSDYHGCLDLHKASAVARDYWSLDRQYWNLWHVNNKDLFLAQYLPDHQGYWTSTQMIHGTSRVTISTADFRRRVLEACRLLAQSPGLNDSDSDRLDDVDEPQWNTDPHDPDTDGDSLPDGEEVYHYDTDPNDADTDHDGCPDGMEVTGGSDPNDPADCP